MDTGQISPIAARAFAVLGGGRLGGVGEARAADPDRRNIGLKNFLIARFQEGANEFLRAEYREIGDHAKRLLFGLTQ